MNTVSTVILLKPDILKRRLEGEIMEALKEGGFLLEQIMRRHLSGSEVDVLYEESMHQPYYADLKRSMLSGEVIFGVIRGADIVSRVNTFVGATNPQTAAVGTLRKRFGMNILENAVHSSNANRVSVELSILYGKASAHFTNQSL